jgi:AcrR family transcriptional regulator
MVKKQKLYRMAKLAQLSGLPRRTIHFYIQSGLLHPPMKTGKTMAYYDDGHLKKLKLIQKEKALGTPLFFIKRKINGTQTVDKSPDGRAFSIEVNLENFENSGKEGMKKKRQSQNRENIIIQGCNLFREKGYKQTKVSDITRVLNIGKGTFCFYFKDKKQLLLECVPMIFQDLFSQGWNKIRNEKEPLKRLQLRAQIVFSVLSEFCAIIQLCKEAMEDKDPKLKQMGREIFLSIRNPLELDIKKGIASKDFRAVDPKIISMMMIGIIESVYYLKDLDQSLIQETIWDNIVQVLVAGIKR